MKQKGEEPMEHTSNYELSKWAESDRILMEDFNMDHDKIDAALAAAASPSHAVGLLSEYDGSADVTVDLGRQPQMVIIGNRNGFTNIIIGQSSYMYPGHAVALPGTPGLKSGYNPAGTGDTILEVTETGFTLYAGFSSNMKPYYYLALF